MTRQAPPSAGSPAPGLRLLFAASEVAGFSKTGGLADVAAALPQALEQRGHRCAVIAPLYRCTRTGKVPLRPTDHRLDIPVGDRRVAGRLWQAVLPDSAVPVYLVEQPDYYERDDPAQGRGLYHFTLANGQKRDYPDNCERYVFFCRAVLEALRLLDYWPDVLHLHDWQTGLVPVYLNELYHTQSPPDLRERYAALRSVCTIHNIAYQGIFGHQDLPLTGLDWRLFNYKQLEFYGHLNFLKAGIVFSDFITTVSPLYAEEIQTPYYGCGLDGVLAERRDRLRGIVNGADYSVWDPAADVHLAERYDVESVEHGKPTCKAALQRRYGLAAEPRTPLLAVISRLVDQKGIDLLGKVAESLLHDGNQFVILGEGDTVYHRMFTALHDRYSERLGLTLGFDEPLAHQIQGGADMLLMPSQYEPSGLIQLYGMKYGTVPVVRATGGLADTVVDATPEALQAGTATGFSFLPYYAPVFRETIDRALTLYREQPEKWLHLLRTGMRQDWSWGRSAAEYERLYRELSKDRAGGNPCPK